MVTIMKSNGEMKFKKLKEFLSTPIKNGYSPVCTDNKTSKKILSLGALTGNKLDLNQIKWVPDENKKVNEFLIKPGDFLVSRSNTIDKVGRSALYRGGLSNCSYPDLIMKFRIKEEKINPDFLEVFLQSDAARMHFMKRASGTSVSMMKITKSVVESLPIPLLSLRQQENVAKTALLWDKAIERIETLVTLKEKQYKWLLRDLIIIHSENPNWKTAKLVKLVDIKKGTQLNRSLLSKVGPFPAWNGGITPSGYTDKWNTLENTITISEGGNSCGFVNYCEEKFWCGGHCYALRNIDEIINTEYLYFFLKANEKKLMRLRVGSGLPNIQKPDIEKLSVYFPDKKQQIYIAQFLKSVKVELSILKQLSHKYYLQKKGLLQNVLKSKSTIGSGVSHD